MWPDRQGPKLTGPPPEPEPEFVQDPMMPPDWRAWETGDKTWHARPPGRPNPLDYVHGATREEVADKAWYQHRQAQDAASTGSDDG